MSGPPPPTSILKFNILLAVVLVAKPNLHMVYVIHKSRYIIGS